MKATTILKGHTRLGDVQLPEIKKVLVGWGYTQTERTIRFRSGGSLTEMSQNTKRIYDIAWKYDLTMTQKEVKVKNLVSKGCHTEIEYVVK